ncbi:MAG TPA: FKBP-type peptidyl-prolyl cis-trans isomerase [Solirubrobacteraceae bacterium]|nr:FKBP-type peptidyl-prolyl cis-trans isomerase [Solirubrobacteraceae bacterium]
MTNSSALTHLLRRGRRRAIPTLVTLSAAVLIAGCGSSGSNSTITIGNENSADNALVKENEAGQVATTATTPTSGPLATEPKVTPPSGAPPTKLETKDLIVGTGPEAKPGDTVTVNYVGVLYSNGKVFDASWKRNEPFTFTLGKGSVIPGWDQGIPGMKVGGRRELIIPAPLAYGARGSGSTIPPNSTLVFVVDLLSV